MDDIAESRSSMTEVRELTKQIEEVLGSGHFQIKHWLSNKALATESNSDKIVTLPGNEEKVLGIKWEMKSDVLFLA
jgi:hypothetical protein